MWDVTGWAVITWLKFTLLATIATGVAWLVFGTTSGWFWTITSLAAVTEGFITRQLGREWLHEASLRWWWNR